MTDDGKRYDPPAEDTTANQKRVVKMRVVSCRGIELMRTQVPYHYDPNRQQRRKEQAHYRRIFGSKTIVEYKIFEKRPVDV